MLKACEPAIAENMHNLVLTLVKYGYLLDVVHHLLPAGWFSHPGQRHALSLVRWTPHS